MLEFLKDASQEKQERYTAIVREKMITRGVDKDVISSFEGTCIGMFFENEKDCPRCEQRKLCQSLEEEIKIDRKRRIEEKHNKEKDGKDSKKEKKEEKKEQKIIQVTKDSVDLNSIKLRFNYDLIPKEYSAQIQQISKQIKQSSKRVLSSMIEMGKYFMQARDLLQKEGKIVITDWLSNEFNMNYHQMHQMIKVASRFGSFTSQIEDKVSFTTLYTLSNENKITDEEFKAILDKIKSGSITGSLDDIQTELDKMHKKEQMANERSRRENEGDNDDNNEDVDNNDDTNEDDENEDNETSKKSKSSDTEDEDSEEDEPESNLQRLDNFKVSVKKEYKFIQTLKNITEEEFETLKELSTIFSNIVIELEEKMGVNDEKDKGKNKKVEKTNKEVKAEKANDGKKEKVEKTSAKAEKSKKKDKK